MFGLSTALIRQLGHCKEIRVLTFRVLALCIRFDERLTLERSTTFYNTVTWPQLFKSGKLDKLYY